MDPFALSTQYQSRLDKSTAAFDRMPELFMQGMKIPGIIAQNTVAMNTARESTEQLSTNDQLRTMIKDPLGFAHQFGELKTADEMRRFIAQHAAISITPMGEKILTGFERVAAVTEDAEQHSVERQLKLATAKKQAEFTAEMIEADVDTTNPLAVQAYKVQRNKSKSLANFVKEAISAGLNPYSVQFGKDAYDDQGNLDPDVARAMMGLAEPLQRYVTQQDIAENRTTAQQAIANARLTSQREGRAFAPSQLERVILESEARGIHFTQDAIEDMVRIRTGIKPRAAKVPTASAFADTHLNAVKRADESEGNARSDRARVAYLKTLYDDVYGEQIPVQPKASDSSEPPMRRRKWLEPKKDTNDTSGELSE